MDVITSLAKQLIKKKTSHPMRIGIDGMTAAGKTTFSRHLAQAFVNRGVSTIIVSLDSFHHPKAIRYSLGRESAEGYYRSAYDTQGIIQNLLSPIATGPDYKFKRQIHDLKTDQPINDPWEYAKADQVLIVDGSFAFRKELRSYFDQKIYIDVDPEISEERAAHRDETFFGSKAKAREMTRNRYHAAHQIYIKNESPSQICDYLVYNNDARNPLILDRRKADGRESSHHPRI